MQPPKTRQPSLFGTVSTANFLQHYWQKKPLLVRQAFPRFVAPVPRQTVCALAARDDVESRLVQSNGGRWRLQTGPFDALPRAKRDWTLLVQGVNLFDKGADTLMRRFDFLPHTRLDDLMVSVAEDGGSVGAHFDSYDVFLLQAQGRRRWRISAQKDLALRDDAPLKILKNFVPEEEFELDAGDMLYLPPQYAHEGVALGACMTYSIGFRAPSFTEMLREFLYESADGIDVPGRVTDAGRKTTAHPGRVDPSLLPALRKRVDALRFTDQALATFLGRFFSEPKAHVFFDQRPEASNSQLGRLYGRSGITLDLKTHLLYDQRFLYANGEAVRLNAQARPWLTRLSDKRRLSATEAAQAIKIDQVAELLSQWHVNGWINSGTSIRKEC